MRPASSLPTVCSQDHMKPAATSTAPLQVLETPKLHEALFYRAAAAAAAAAKPCNIQLCGEQVFSFDNWNYFVAAAQLCNKATAATSWPCKYG